MVNKDFTARVTGTDAFTSLSFEAQALYFHLSLAADGDGFVAAPKRVTKGMGASDSALDELMAVGCLLPFQGGARLLAECGEPREEGREERRRRKTRERVRRYRERKRAQAAKAADGTPCNADVTPCNADVTPAPSSSYLPPSFPSLPSPTPLSNTPPISPLKNTSSQENLSSSSFWGARVQELARRFWDRDLRSYELDSVLWIAERLLRRYDEVDERIREDDMELLEIAFNASAEAGVCSIAYLRGVYGNWRKNGISTSDDYWNHELKRDGVGSSVGSRVEQK